MKQLMQKIYGCEAENNGTQTIVNALIWAVAILMASWLMQGHENADAIVLMLVGLSTVSLIAPSRKQKGE